MSVNAITTGMGEINSMIRQTGNPAGASPPPALNPTRYASRTADSVRISNKAATKATESTAAHKDRTKQPITRHVIEQYNSQGKLRIKFVDSRTKVIYQLPSEMIAKAEDLMLKPTVSANVVA